MHLPKDALEYWSRQILHHEALTLWDFRRSSTMTCHDQLLILFIVVDEQEGLADPERQ
jgi:hypothetical protein